MSRARRVLVAATHHHRPAAALEHAAALASSRGEVVLAAVLVVPLAQPLDANLDRAVAASCEVLEWAEREAGGAFDTRLVRARSFAEGVLELLARESFDLLVLESCRTGAPGDVRHGQIETILDRAPVAVAVVRAAPERSGL